MALLSFPSYVALQFKEGNLDCQLRESGRFLIIVAYGAQHTHGEDNARSYRSAWTAPSSEHGEPGSSLGA